MKATGIVRRIDDLGRVVIPKEIRRTLRIREGDPLEIFVDRDGEVILKKYSPIGELGDFAQEYAESIHEATKQVTIITDRDAVIAVSGAVKKEFIDKRISEMIERAMESRQSIAVEQDATQPLLLDEETSSFSSYVISPIVANGDAIGAVIICGRDEVHAIGEVEQKLAETAAGFLARQMED